MTRRHRIRLPRGILLYAKATLQTEALVKQLDPYFEMLPVFEGMAPADRRTGALRGRRARGARVPRAVADYARLVAELPERTPLAEDAEGRLISSGVS